MDLRQASAVSGGSVGGLLLTLLHSHIFESPLSLPAPYSSFDASVLDCIPEGIDTRSFLIGLVCGVALGPALDLLQVFRSYLRRLRERLCLWVQRPHFVLYKVNEL